MDFRASQFAAHSGLPLDVGLLTHNTHLEGVELSTRNGRLIRMDPKHVHL